MNGKFLDLRKTKKWSKTNNIAPHVEYKRVTEVNNNGKNMKLWGHSFDKKLNFQSKS